ncbi:hypothetical protein U1Q18_024684, partial [Sarracenia purpurea var. burkii]
MEIACELSLISLVASQFFAGYVPFWACCLRRFVSLLLSFLIPTAVCVVCSWLLLPCCCFSCRGVNIQGLVLVYDVLQSMLLNPLLFGTILLRRSFR